MNNETTHITVILDRSGSMGSIRDDTIGGFNTFLQSQKETPGKATLTLVQFDGQDPYEIIHHFRPLDQVPELTRNTFVPRGNTPLLDALGRGMNDLEAGLHRMEKEARPGQVVFAIVTDGMENASREFTRRQIESMIQAKKEKENWQFAFLSADLAAVGEAVDLGVHADAAIAYEKHAVGTAQAWSRLDRNMSAFRTKKNRDFTFRE